MVKYTCHKKLTQPSFENPLSLYRRKDYSKRDEGQSVRCHDAIVLRAVGEARVSFAEYVSELEGYLSRQGI